MRVIALNFHGIGVPHAGVPAEERPYWFSHTAFAELIDRIWRNHDPARFAFTFDDGNASDLAAAELLARRGVKARFFLLTGRMGHAHYCSADDARELLRMGMVVGLHGRDHLDWRKLDDAQLRAETLGAREELADAIGQAVEEVAIPFGRYNRRVLRWLSRQGFTHIHTSDPGAIGGLHAHIWNRNTLRSDMGGDQLEQILAGRWPPHLHLRNAVSRLARRGLV